MDSPVRKTEMLNRGLTRVQTMGQCCAVALKTTVFSTLRCGDCLERLLSEAPVFHLVVRFGHSVDQFLRIDICSELKTTSQLIEIGFDFDNTFGFQIASHGSFAASSDHVWQLE